MKRALPFVLLGVLGCEARLDHDRDPQRGVVTTPTATSPIALAAGPRLVVHAPALANGALHVERSPGISLDIEPVGARPVAARAEPDGRVVYDDAFEATRVVHLATPGRTEELRFVARKTEATLSYRVHLGAALATLRVVDDYVEALDRDGIAWLRTEPAFLVDARGLRRALSPKVTRDGDAFRLEWPIDDAGLAYPLAIDPAWTLTTSLAHPRRDNALVVLPTGKAATFAGLGGSALSSVEIFDPPTATWTAGTPLQRARISPTAVLLPSGKVLIAGGGGLSTQPDTGSSAELYDPVAGTSTLFSSRASGDIGYFGLGFVLAGTQVLIVGAENTFLLDVGTGTWTDAPTLVVRDSAGGVQLPSGDVLIAGGSQPDAMHTPIAEAEIFSASTKTWKSAGMMHVARAKPEVQMLPSGKALVAGGLGQTSTELFDPASGTWTNGPSMSSGHAFGGSVVLPTHQVLVIAGDLTDGLSDAADLYDPTTNMWAFAGRLAGPRDEFGFALLPSGKVLVAGGSAGSPVAISEIFDPQPLGRTCLGPGECTSGFCTEGYCCEKSACGAGETCAGSGAPGKCAKKDGSTCSSDVECGSAHCVDGFCCNSACTDPCGACNVKGSEGRCVPVAAGDAPHGMRAACPGDGACQARCGGVDPTRCTQFPGTAVSCGAPTCEAGSETLPRGCDGAGGCAPSMVRPCAPYACGTGACKSQCDSDADCVDGNTCDLVGRRCVIAAKCDGDHTVTSPDGLAKDCAPFRCDGSRCLDTCSDSSACASGYVCDTSAGRCVVGAPSGDASSGGCAIDDTRTRKGGAGGLALLFALGLLARRMRARG